MRFGRAGRPPVADVMVAAGLLVAALTEVWVTGTGNGPRGMATVVALVSAAPLAWRRTSPIVAVTATVVAVLLPLVARPVVATDGLAIVIAWLVAVHAINAYRPVRSAVLGTLAVAVSIAVVIAIQPAPPGQQRGDVVWALAIFGSAAAAGQVMRRLGARLVSERIAAEAQARAVEHQRLAHELHDVVAHGVAVMVVQAGAAQQLVHTDPERSFRLLDDVQRTGEQSAAELRRMLDLWGGEHAGLDPQPRLADLPHLLERVRAAGLRTELDYTVPSENVALGLQATAYRVVQESLTNALKHGARHAVSVKVRSDGDVLAVTVDDKGGIGSPQRAGGPGHGLYGLKERVLLFGGSFTAGPEGPGWRVQALLPLDPPTHPRHGTPAPPARPGSAP